MKALVLESVGQLKYKEVPTPTPGEDEVLLKIHACGICSSDFDRCLKTGTYHFPTIPGHEFAGQIVALGKGVDSSLLGKRSVVFPLLPCKKCDQCKIEAYARCRNYNYFGSRCDGAFAENIAVPLWNIQTFGDSLDYDVAALCEPAAVAFHAVDAANISGGASVCVVGTGTIGIMVGIWAKEKGCDITFASRSKSKNLFLQQLGFDSFIPSGVRSSSEFDVVFECVGSDSALGSSIEMVKSSGSVILVGNPNGDMKLSRTSYWKVLRSELTIKGIWNSNYKGEDNDWKRVLHALSMKQEIFKKLITSRFSLAQGLSAFDAFKKSSKIEIKGMFVNE